MWSCLVFLALLVSDRAPWELVNEDDSISVWARQVEDSKIRELKATTLIPAPIQRVWDVVMQSAAYTEFMPYVEEIKNMGTSDDGGYYEYQRIDPPIVDRRDFTYKVTWQKDEAQGIFIKKWEAANNRGPELRGDAVRVTTLRGSFTLEKLDPSITRLTYWLYTDPGGSIPSWVANKANTTSLPDVMRAVRNRSVHPAWKRY